MERPRPSRRKLVLLILPIVLVAAAGTIATALTPVLATQHPLLLIALDARNRFLVLARRVSVVPFFVVATLRRMSSDPFYFLLGRYYGDSAVRWLEKKGGGGSFVRMTESFFHRAGPLMVFLFPGAIVCALAGAAGMRPATFFVLNVLGTLTSVVAVRLFGDLVAHPIEAVLGFFERNLVTTTAVTVGLVALSFLLGRLEGSGDVGSIDELEQELEGDAEGVGERGQAGGRAPAAGRAEGVDEADATAGEPGD